LYAPDSGALSWCVDEYVQKNMTEFGSLVGGMFGGRANFEGKDPAYIDDTIRSGQIRLAALNWTMFILACLSIFIELVAGYCVGGGAANVTWSALPHGVWMVPNLLTLFMANQAIYLGTDTDIAATLTQLSVSTWFVLVACVLNLVQLLAVCFEVNNANSTFWLQNGGAWVWVLLFGLIVFIGWDVLIAWHLFVYRSNMELAHYQYGWMPSGVKAGSLGSVATDPTATTPDDGSAAAAAASTPDPTTAAAAARLGGKFTPHGVLVSKTTKGQ
jgi:hypothetical protein